MVMGTSVVIVTYHTGPALWLAIDAALAQADCDVMVVNNGNPGDVVKRLEADSRIRLVSGQGNVGFAKACNLGVARSVQEYILLLNPDCILPPQALAPMQEALKAQAAILAGACLINVDGTEQRGGRRNRLTPQTAWNEAFSASHARGLNLHNTSGNDQVSEVPAISGAFMFLRRSDYQRLGGMDEGYFLHMEDMDFCLRVHRAGGKILYVPQVKVLHLRSTSDVSSRTLEWCKAKGFMRYFRLHFASPWRPLWNLGIMLRFVAKALLATWGEFKQVPQQRKRRNNRLLWLMREVAPEAGPWLQGQTVMITGAGSQIGICAIAEMLNAGAQVVALTHSVDVPYAHPRLRWHRATLEESGWLPDDVKPDILVHTAGLWLLPDILPALFAAGTKRVLAFSSMSAATKEDSSYTYERDVSQSLRSAEERAFALCKDAGAACTIFRPSMIYGLGLDRNVTRLASTMRRLRLFPIYKKAEGLRQPVHAQDLAIAARHCIPNPSTYGKRYELGGGTRLAYRDMLAHVCKAVGLPCRLVSVPHMPLLLTLAGMVYQMNQLHGEVALRMNRDMVCDNQPAEQDFSFSPRPFILTADML